MLLYLFHRFIALALTLWLAFTLSFVALRSLPGDFMAASLARSGAAPEQIAARRATLGLDQPFLIQYMQSLTALLQGDPGLSLLTGRPVAQMIAEQFGATLALAAGSLLVGTGLGLALGILAGLSRSRGGRAAAGIVITLLLSSPVYWMGTLAILVFSVWLRWLPSAGMDGLRGLILPSLALGLSLAGSIARVTANSLHDLSEAEFLRTARAKGLRPRQITLDHLLRASLGPILSVIGLQAGFLIGGTVVTEALFVRQGIGQVMLAALQDRDFPVIQGLVLLSAASYSLINLLVDLLTAALDPRVRAQA